MGQLTVRSVQSLRDRFYPVQVDGNRSRDGTLQFYNWVRAIPAAQNARVLNLGASASTDVERRMRGRFATLVGVDIDPAVKENGDLDEAYVTDGVNLPFSNATFDLVYSDWTLEHVSDPRGLVNDVFRVLRPGGAFMFRTPNVYHYVPLVGRLTPHSFHVLVAQHVRSSVVPEPWRTFYRVNTPRKARRLLSAAGFGDIEINGIEPEPSYLAFHGLAFLAGIGYERILNSASVFAPLRHVILARAFRPRAS